MYTPYECHKNVNEHLNKLAFIGSYIRESESMFVLGDLNADISDMNSLFGQYLIQFCKDNKVILSTKESLPADSYTHVGEAWHTTSWLDHCILLMIHMIV